MESACGEAWFNLPEQLLNTGYNAANMLIVCMWFFL